jgi:beta-xylosidase
MVLSVQTPNNSLLASSPMEAFEIEDELKFKQWVEGIVPHLNAQPAYYQLRFATPLITQPLCSLII